MVENEIIQKLWENYSQKIEKKIKNMEIMTIIKNY